MADWTREQEQQLKQLCNEDLSAAEIGLRIGKTRNAVACKADRMGIELPYAGMHSAPRARSRHEAERNRSLAELFASDASEDCFAERPCALVDLDSTTCRWPCGDVASDGFHFCGGQPLAGLPYCAHHSRVAYRAPASAQQLKQVAA